MPSSEPGNDLSRLSDAALWQAHVEGAGAAFAEIVRRYGEALFRYLVLSLPNPGSAAQQFGRVLRAVAECREPLRGFDSLKGWLLAVATQTAAPAHSGHEEGLRNVLDELGRPRPRSEHERILLALSELRREHRQPFLLVTVAGLSVAECAKACRFTVAHTRRALTQAYGQLAGSGAFEQE